MPNLGVSKTINLNRTMSNRMLFTLLKPGLRGPGELCTAPRLALKLIPVLAGAALGLGPVSAAQAGYWRVQKYVFQGQTINDGNAWVNETNLDRTYQLKRTTGEDYDPNNDGYFHTQGEWGTVMTINHGTVTAPVGVPGKIWTNCVGQVHAVLHWERDWKYDPDTFEEYPDPDDNPPRAVWVWEQGETEIVRRQSAYHYDLYDEAHPFTGGPFTITLHDFQLGSEKASYHESGDVRVPVSRFYPGGYGNPWMYLINNKSGWNLSRHETMGQDTIHLPCASFSGEVKGPKIDWLGKQGAADVICRYKAQVVSLNLLSRRQGFAGPPADGSSIAAGGNNDERHKAEIWVDLRDAETGAALYGVPISRLPKLTFRDNSEKGVELDASLLKGAEAVDENGQPEIDPEALTDGNGRALIALMKSSDRVNPLDLTDPDQTSYKVAVVFAKANPTPITTVGQRWDEVRYWEVPTPAVLEGTVIPVKFKPSFGGKSVNGAPENIQIKHHTMRLRVSRARVTEYDDTTKQTFERLYTSDRQEADNSDDPNVLYMSLDDLMNKFQDVVKFYPATLSEDADGIYQSDMQVEPSNQYIFHELNLVAEDGVVYTYAQNPAG